MDHGGASGDEQRSAEKNGGTNGMNHDPEGMQGMDMETVAPEDAGVNVRLTSEPAAPLAGEPVSLSYRLTEAGNGRVLTDLPIDHERPMHLIAVSKDLRHFQHVHPEANPDGEYIVRSEFPEAGTYVLYDEFKHAESTVLDRRELRVGEASDAGASLSPDLSPKTAEGVEVSLAAPEEIRAGEESSFTFTLTRDGEPVTDLEPYLGAAAHVAIASADTQEFAHTHGEARGAAHGTGGDAHEEHEGTGSSSDSGDAALGPEISFHHTFPSPGLYKVWGQFSRDGRVITVPFVVEVV